MAQIVFGFKAIKPITAEHPPGTGTVVTYQPGDEVPASEWKGAAVEALIENEKLMRYATNVYGPGEVGGDSLASYASDDEVALRAQVAELERQVAELQGGAGSLGFDIPPEVHTGENALVATVGDGPFPRALGGGSYELSDGSRVKGKAKALAAQAVLDVAAEDA